MGATVGATIAPVTAVPPERLPYTLCFITRGSRLLLLRRRREPNLGLWTGVGGKLEPGEKPRQAILREIREETGLELDGIRFGGIVTWYEHEGLRAGVYAYVATLPEDATYDTPRETDEGVLDWKERAWALDPANEQVPASARRFLAAMLDGATPHEHYFLLTNDQIAEYRLLPLDGWEDFIDPPRAAAALGG